MMSVAVAVESMQISMAELKGFLLLWHS